MGSAGPRGGAWSDFQLGARSRLACRAGQAFHPRGGWRSTRELFPARSGLAHDAAVTYPSSCTVYPGAPIWCDG